MSAFLRISVLMVLLLPLTSPALGAERVVDKIVAMVNGEVVTLFELNERVDRYATQVLKQKVAHGTSSYRELQDRILKTMVEDLLLKQEATRLKITVTDTEVESRIKEIKDKNGLTEERFVQQLQLEGLTRKEFTQSLKRDILKKNLLGYMVQRKVLVTDDEVKAYYDANKSSLRPQTGQRIGLIMVAKMDDAKALRQKIVSKQISFAEAARKFSVGPGAEQGGDLGKVELKDLAPELGEALKAAPPGGVSQPVLLDGKPVLLTIIASDGDKAQQPQGDPALESVRAEIYDTLYREKLEKQFAEYLDRLRAKSVIKTNL